MGERGVIVSLALIKAREPNIGKIIRSWTKQSVLPKKILIFISKKNFYLDDGFNYKPDIKCKRSNVFFVENTGALRKFLPALKMYWNKKNQKILLTDDDHVYYRDFIKDILKWEKNIDGVISGAGNLYRNSDPYNWDKKWFHGDTITKPTRCDIISTGYGCLIKPKYFTDEIFQWEQYRRWGVPYDDEFWFNYMLAKNNVKRYVVPIKTRRKKLEHFGVDMFRSKKSRQAKANVTKEFKKTIMDV